VARVPNSALSLSQHRDEDASENAQRERFNMTILLVSCRGNAAAPQSLQRSVSQCAEYFERHAFQPKRRGRNADRNTGLDFHCRSARTRRSTSSNAASGCGMIALMGQRSSSQVSGR